jgi:hypothetical protein
VTVNDPGPITRGQLAYFTAAISDDRDSNNQLTITWGVRSSFNQGCEQITPATFETEPSSTDIQLASTASYFYRPADLGVDCVCAEAVDRDGAKAVGCLPIQASNPSPRATIVDLDGYLSGNPRPLCSLVRLSAKQSIYFPEDTLSFDWSLGYSGPDPNGGLVQFVDCDGVTTDLDKKLNRCFPTGVPGTYTVSLSITDKPDNVAAQTSATTSFVALVSTDTPPCLQRTDPDVHAQVIMLMLSHSTDIGAPPPSRTFKVLSAADDCEPYPVPANSSKNATQFVWSVYDGTKATPSWVYQTDTTDTFTVSQANFPNARPADAVKVRVEVRDANVQRLYTQGIPACPSDQTDICCGPNGCTGTNDCIRWTTWTVQFQP